MRTFSYIILAFLALTFTWQVQPAYSQPGDTINVTATGIGKDKEAALKDALRAAVEQAVGVLVDAETVVVNDDLIRDKILTFSGGFVQTYKQLGEPRVRDDGLVYVRISAEVKRNELGAELRKTGVTKEPLDGESLIAERMTKIRSREDGIEMLKWMIEERLLNCISVSKAAEPRFDLNQNKVVLEIRTTLDYAKYSVFVKHFTDVLKKLGVQYEGSRAFTIERRNRTNRLVTAIDLVDSGTSRQVQFVPVQTRGGVRWESTDCMLYIGTSRWRVLASEGQKSRVDFGVYELPREIFDEIRNSLITLKEKLTIIALLDDEDRTVAIGKTPVCRPFYDLSTRFQQKAPIMFFPSLSRWEGDLSFWPGIPEHREEIYLDIPMDDMKRIRNIQFRYEKDAMAARDDSVQGRLPIFTPGQRGQGTFPRSQ